MTDKSIFGITNTGGGSSLDTGGLISGDLVIDGDLNITGSIPNRFDQELNTTNDVTFNTVNSDELKVDGWTIEPDGNELVIKVDGLVHMRLNPMNVTKLINLNINDSIFLGSGGVIACDTFFEKTLNTGVTVENVLLKDGLVDGVDVGTLSAYDQSLNTTDNVTFNSVTAAHNTDTWSIVEGPPGLTFRKKGGAAAITVDDSLKTSLNGDLNIASQSRISWGTVESSRTITGNAAGELALYGKNGVVVESDLITNSTYAKDLSIKPDDPLSVGLLNVTNTLDELVFQVTKDGVCGVKDTLKTETVKATTAVIRTLQTEAEIYSTQELENSTFEFRPEHLGIINEIQPNEALFVQVDDQRQITTLQGVYPLHIPVGGWVMWDLNVSAFLGNSFFSGIIFKNPSTEYLGFKIGADTYGHDVLSLVQNRLYADGLPGVITTPGSAMRTGLFQVKITRSAVDTWVVSFPGINEVVNFGTDRSNQMFYLVICDFIFGASSVQVSITNFTHQGWIPDVTSYTFSQNKDNTLKMTSGGQDVISFSTTGVEIGSSVRAAGAVTTHTKKFGYPCFVSSAFYMGYAGFTLSNTINEIEIHKQARTYGRPFIPNHIRGGQNYRIRIRGRIGTAGANVAITFRIYLGAQQIAISQPGEVIKGLTDKYFEIDTSTIVDEYTDIGLRKYRVTTHGKFLFHSKENDKDTIEGMGITTNFLGPTIDQTDELELRVTASFGVADPSNVLKCDNCVYEFFGFNL